MIQKKKDEREGGRVTQREREREKREGGEGGGKGGKNEEGASVKKGWERGRQVALKGIMWPSPLPSPPSGSLLPPP